MKEVIIGNQSWIVENLDVDTFQNGDAIPEAKSQSEWEKAGANKEPAWCYYNFDVANGVKFGKLYNWFAVNDSRRLAPVGWEIPSVEKYSILIDLLGGENVAGKKMKSTNLWADFEGVNGNGTNESEFTGLPGGSCSYDGVFEYQNLGGFWWSSTEDDADYSFGFTLGYAGNNIEKNQFSKEEGLYVRIIKS